MKRLNKARLKAFIQRRRINALSLLVLTFLSAVMTVICAVQGFARTDILALVTIALIVLCLIQEIQLKRKFTSVSGTLKRRKS